MAVAAALSPVLAIGGFKVTNNANEMEWSIEQSPQDATTFASGGYMAYTPGLKTLKVESKGFNDFAAGGFDEWQRGISYTQQIFNLAPAGDTVANPAVISQALITVQEGVDGKPGTTSAFDLTAQPVGNVVGQGQVTQSTTTTISATGHTSPVNIGAVSATQTIYVAINVLAITGSATPTATFQLESSTTSGGAYTLRGSAGAGITATGAQWISAAGPFTDTWWKLAVTLTGTSPVFTVLASIAIA